jgi:Lon protease-like protein
MPMNAQYRGPIEMPAVISVFPLPGALLLPRGQMPLNIFEPRYLAMVDDALRDGHRLIGMIQPDIAHGGADDKPSLYKIGCAGRITQFAESGDGRYLIELTGVARFRIEEELKVSTSYGTAEKQALLEAPDLKTRAEILIAITEIELAKRNTEGEPQLQ